MKNMKVIPVIDILERRVVHAKGGKRRLYEPLKSSLFSSADPIDVVNELEKIGFREIYLADLDSIMKNQTNYVLLEKIKNNSEIELIVDAGVSEKDQVIQLFNENVQKVIIGTETLTSLKFLKEVVNYFGNKNIILSLDIMNDKLLNKLNLKHPNDLLTFLNSIKEIGISQIIVLDLSRVGSGRGVNNCILKKILSQFNDLKVIVGGGIQDISELIELKKLGVYGVLIGTALYSNLINVSDLKNKGFLPQKRSK